VYTLVYTALHIRVISGTESSSILISKYPACLVYPGKVFEFIKRSIDNRPIKLSVHHIPFTENARTQL